VKILFASHIPNQHIKDKDPLGIMCLSATLKQANHEVRICSPEVRETGKMLEEFPADVIAYSIATGDHSFYIDFNRVIKNRHKNIYSVFGGPHCTFNPDFITENLGVDAMASGEVDLTFVDFINSLESDGDYHLTPNFHVRRDGEIYRNEISNHIPDIDDLPFPDRSVIYDYYPKAAAGKVKSFMSMRGCPYPCTYCHNHKFNEMMKGKGKILRRRSVDNVIEEILNVSKNYPLELVYFRDDSFNLGADWIEDFSEQYSKRVKLPFVCTSHLNAMTENVARNLKKAGCVTVEVGIESGNTRVRNEILKRHMKDETIIEGVKILKSNGIKILAENILGNPGSSLDDDLETFTMNKKCKVDYVNAGLLQPMFGTDIYETAIKEKELTVESYKASEQDKISYLTGDTLLNITNMKERMRLNKIIAICVNFRLPLFLVKILIHLPLQSVYSLVNVAFKGYAGSRLYPYTLSIKETISTVIDVLKMGRSNIDKRLGDSLNQFLLVEKLDQGKNSANQKLGELL
jgi:radical SAM superfamily enzyme YgiQ (UPF0313 family)